MTIEPESVRLAVYRALADTGRAPTSGALARQFDSSIEDITTALGALVDDRHLVLGPDGSIELAHPFATRDFGFVVKGASTLWWGGCAWDAFAIPHLVGSADPVLVATTCPACRTPHAWNVDTTAPPAGTQVAHFLVPMAKVWNDVVHACEHQRIFCDQACVDQWLRTTGHQPGSVFPLENLWRLAAGWYAGRLSRGYQRREPAAAAASFEEAGLTGAFWGTPEPPTPPT